ncbi:DUF6441 family protein [Sulfurivermis fontis]|uniref:DUF6441 family protein n=1 Tax=Sulfurivermis fontis TaxID=1972068 RepID=UPI000FDC518A|nr:DUF6441 family protein [Sulfurivermis fontis]
MKLSITASGLLDPNRLDSWIPEKRRAIRKAVEAGMRAAGKEMARSAQARMRSAFAVRRASFVRSMRHKVYAGSPDKFPGLLIGSRIPWLGIHVRGGTIRGRMLIPLLPEHQRIGRKAFRHVIDGLMRSGNAFFIQKDGKVILMAENIRENAAQLRRFKSAERKRTGAKQIKRGQEIPIAVLVKSVALKRRFDLAGSVQGALPGLARAIERELG